ncbi:hypothetical protein Pst134EA_019570 [Puccinia striiformis f. sp. tritici]|uniref:hypothetical protein n=1 Tax=Puccinia striiformis f. sp. tritici TaxID=168172 RepID=UPI002007B64C|nr:hypothetical protein Pst134EA_019570 [Puccinia striiformis f. sp. tritici]KAH9459417.1 hypothetical protein Pst134EA_019570 [Puccinia striiformis f. sp. tritici]
MTRRAAPAFEGRVIRRVGGVHTHPFRLSSSFAISHPSSHATKITVLKLVGVLLGPTLPSSGLHEPVYLSNDHPRSLALLESTMTAVVLSSQTIRCGLTISLEQIERAVSTDK